MTKVTSPPCGGTEACGNEWELVQQQYDRNVLLSSSSALDHSPLAAFLRRPSLHDPTEQSMSLDASSTAKEDGTLLPRLLPSVASPGVRNRKDNHAEAPTPRSSLSQTYMVSPFPGRHAVLVFRPVDRPCDDEAQGRHEDATHGATASPCEVSSSREGSSDVSQPPFVAGGAAAFPSIVPADGAGESCRATTAFVYPSSLPCCVAACTTGTVHPTVPSLPCFFLDGGGASAERRSEERTLNDLIPTPSSLARFSSVSDSGTPHRPGIPQPKGVTGERQRMLGKSRTTSSAAPRTDRLVPRTGNTTAFPTCCPLSASPPTRRYHWSDGMQGCVERVQGEASGGSYVLDRTAVPFTALIETLAHAHFSPLPPRRALLDTSWGLKWAKRPLPSEFDSISVRTGQKMNHFPGSSGLGRKDGLHRLLHAACDGLRPKDTSSLRKVSHAQGEGAIPKGVEDGAFPWHSYFPRGYLMPEDFSRLAQAVREVYAHYHPSSPRKVSPHEGAGEAGSRPPLRQMPSTPPHTRKEAREEKPPLEGIRSSPLPSSSWFIVKPTNAACGKGIYIIDAMGSSWTVLQSALDRLTSDAVGENSNTVVPTGVKENASSEKGVGHTTQSRLSSRPSAALSFSSPSASLPSSTFIVQEYVDRPFLVYGYKMDLRLYVVVTSYAPLRCYVYHEGLVRFATTPYYTPHQHPEEEEEECHHRRGPISPSRTSASECTAHLTNFTINKKSEDYIIPRRREAPKTKKEEEEETQEAVGNPRSEKVEEPPMGHEGRREVPALPSTASPSLRPAERDTSSTPLTSKWSLSALAAYVDAQVVGVAVGGPPPPPHSSPATTSDTVPSVGATASPPTQRPTEVHYSWRKTWAAIEEALALVFLSVRPSVVQALQRIDDKQARRKPTKEGKVSQSPSRELPPPPKVDPFLSSSASLPSVESKKPPMTYRGVSPFFEIYGVDVLLQHPEEDLFPTRPPSSSSFPLAVHDSPHATGESIALHPVVLEVNIMPSLSTHYSPLDQTIKGNFVADALTLVGIRGEEEEVKRNMPGGGSGSGGQAVAGGKQNRPNAAVLHETHQKVCGGTSSWTLHEEEEVAPLANTKDGDGELSPPQGKEDSFLFSVTEHVKAFLSFTSSTAAKEAIYTAEEEFRRAPHFHRVFPPVACAAASLDASPTVVSARPSSLNTPDAFLSVSSWWMTFLSSVPLRRRSLFDLLQLSPPNASDGVSPSSSLSTMHLRWSLTSPEDLASFVIPLELLLYAWEEWKKMIKRDGFL